MLPADADNKKVTWKSDNETLASVDANGLVTAKAEGVARITAKTVSGGHSAVCKATVAERPKMAIEYVAEYNVSEKPGVFATSHANYGNNNHVSGYYNWKTPKPPYPTDTTCPLWKSGAALFRTVIRTKWSFLIFPALPTMWRRKLP